MKDLQHILQNYGVSGEVVSISKGPLLEMTEVKLAPGSKIKNLLTLKDDIQRELGVSSLSIAQHPNNTSVWFEYPCSDFEVIDFNKVLVSEEFQIAKDNHTLPICLGVDIYGNPCVKDLSKMPHLLVGGTTGSGKSVGLNTFILSLIVSKTPEEVKFVLIDPKKIEFSIYNNQEYLYCPVLTETSDAVLTLSHLAKLMDERYELFSKTLSKNLKEYNQTSKTPLPYIVCIIDEFADLMSLDKSIQKDVMRLAQKARAAGIHLIIATQRPSVDVITGVLKANFPTRLSYKVASSADSRTILDDIGAQDLVGRGDAYFRQSNGELLRIHGAFIEDNDIKSILSPYSCKILPLKLKQDKDDTQKSSSSTKSSPSFLTRFAIFWSKLRQKDRDLIIKGIKYIFTFVVNQMSKSSSKKRR